MSVKEVDRIIGSLGRISLLAQLRDKVAHAWHGGRPRCGACYFWMKSSQCPREKNVKGYSGGPSSEDAPCEKFHRTEASRRIQADRVAEAIAFAEKHGLPVPEHLPTPINSETEAGAS